jgi:hypothetical protein
MPHLNECNEISFGAYYVYPLLLILRKVSGRKTHTNIFHENKWRTKRKSIS